MLSRRQLAAIAGSFLATLCLGGCASNASSEKVLSRAVPAQTARERTDEEAVLSEPPVSYDPVEPSTPIQDVIDHPLFEGFGHLLFPTGFSAPEPGMTLADLPSCLPWYSEIRVETTLDVINELLARRAAGKTVFCNIYSDEEKTANPDLENTGLFLFLAEDENGIEIPHAPFAIVSAGGGFAYVAAMHDSLPHCLHLSRSGLNGIALIYRPSAQAACEDLARAVSFAFANADELGICIEGYSLWGGSAGARMAAYVGGWGPRAFGGDAPRPAAVIMQYTGHREISHTDPPTYACVGDRDGIASWSSMKARIDALARQGTPTEFHVYEGLRHGFGLGIGTVAEGWIDDATSFWLANR